jgi:hypothetical protein
MSAIKERHHTQIDSSPFYENNFRFLKIKLYASSFLSSFDTAVMVVIPQKATASTIIQGLQCYVAQIN